MGRNNIFITFFKIGCTSFGASASEIIIEIIVEKKEWLTINEIRQSLSLAGLVPGPFHINFVMNIGYRLKGYPGLFMALTGFILPSFFLAYALWILLSVDKIVYFLKENPGITNGIIAGISGFLINAVIKLSKGIISSLHYIILIILIVMIMLYFKIAFFSVIIGTGILFIVYYHFRGSMD